MIDNIMTRDSEIPAIFNPKRVRAPSVVVTGDSPNGPFGGGGFINNVPQIMHSDSVTSSQHDGQDSLIGVTVTGAGCETPPPGVSVVAGTTVANNTNANVATEGTAPTTATSRLKRCRDSCCSELAQKMYFGVCVTILVTASWVGATHCIKFLYLRRNAYASTLPPHLTALITDSEPLLTADANSSALIVHGFGPTTSFMPSTIKSIVTSDRITPPSSAHIFNAPFFASWFCTNFSILFFPIYILGRVAIKKCDGTGEVIGEILRGFRDRGFTIGRFLNRCLTFCILWLLTTYLYALSLKALLATDVMALFATNVACVYLLAWVILQEQFVGVRIVAVILCDTGIALLAYMDGITGSPTLGGVVLAALSAAGYAVFKVMFRKVMGDPPVGQIAFTFSFIGFLNAAILWPVCIALYFTGAEVMPWEPLPWIVLLMASVLLLVFHILTQFSSAVTYNMFVTLGLITAVPVSAALDIVLYGAHFAGMKLSGIILIAVGFFLVMFPDNWPDYITRLLRKTGRALLRNQCCCQSGDQDYENSKYHLVGSQREMGPSSSKRYSFAIPRRHRLSDGLHSIASSLSLWPGEMTAEQQLQQQQQQNVHFQHYIRSEYGSDSVGLNMKQRHYSMDTETSFGRRGKRCNSSTTMALPPIRQINCRSSSFGSLE
ncbi:uncharacterized protein LOC131677427 isoform X2 [Topomyia yanbarensis]|uniref:uncharacterized protein LOC131677427 isoform X2 n=1 Tax=Topomyia yanbarensis TaxID=2498891 RepID=UPI00273C8FAD|nr:uncharacterized protein LOC131677427 isoform X2 [Topomyia yanbarensis]